MQQRYDYIRPAGGMPRRRRRGFLTYFVVLALFAAIVCFFYLNLKVKPEKHKLETNEKIANIHLQIKSSLENLTEFAYQGPKADKVRVQALKNSLTALNGAQSILEKERALTPKQLKAIAELISLASRLELTARFSFDEQLLKQSLPLLYNEYNRLSNLITELRPKRGDKDKITFSLLFFEPEKVFRIQENPELANKRRGLGIVSFTTQPKFSEKRRDGIYELPLSEYLDLHLEIQNQGEIIEKNVQVTLNLESTALAEPLSLDEKIPEIKPRERKPVSFTRIPLEAKPGTIYFLKVFVKPVAGEKVLENNKLSLKFYLAP